MLNYLFSEYLQEVLSFPTLRLPGNGASKITTNTRDSHAKKKKKKEKRQKILYTIDPLGKQFGSRLTHANNEQ